MTNEITNERKTHKVSAKKVKVDDLMAFTYYVKVATVTDNRYEPVLYVKNLDEGAKEIKVEGRELIENALSADQYSEEVTLPKTQVVRILENLYNRPFTVAFVKKDGSDRVLRGRLVDSDEVNLGYVRVEDLDVTGDNRLRKVDNRTIKYLIAEGVKYNVK